MDKGLVTIQFPAVFDAFLSRLARPLWGKSQQDLLLFILVLCSYLIITDERKTEEKKLRKGEVV